MNTLTKEWLQNTITSIESARDEIPFGLDEDQNNMLTALKIALASLEAEQAPSIPEPMTEEKAYSNVQTSWHDAQYYTTGWNACRAAMLQGKGE